MGPLLFIIICCLLTTTTPKDLEITAEQVGDTEDHFVSCTKAMLEIVPPFPSEPCIYRVPYFLRLVNEEAYTPVIISIGPFHHGKSTLEAMEVNKKRYLNDFLKRRPEVKLGDYVKTLRDLEERARGSYGESINITSDDFIQILLLDGCFIVELLLKDAYIELINKTDILFKASSTRRVLLRDMLLIENQLPFFILERLFNQNVQGGLYKGQSFIQITSDFFDVSPLEDSSYQVKHFVDLFLLNNRPTEPRKPPKGNVEFINIPTATQLHEAGVKFRKISIDTGKSFLDVKFAHGVFEIPTLKVEDDTDYLFRNMIAMEKSDDENSHHISDYEWLIDCLIDSSDDVSLLRGFGVIDNWLGDDEEVSQLVNKLGSGLEYHGDFYYCRLCEDVNAYCKIPWHKWLAKLNRDYFNTPWAIISFFAALLLLILSLLQTVNSFRALIYQR